MPKNRFNRYMILVAGLVVLDQIVKLLIKLNMQPGQEFNLVGDLFKIHFLENPGAAGGLTITQLVSFITPISDETGKVILTLFSLVAVTFIGWFLKSVSTAPHRLPLYVALIMSGALGNIIDRVFYGWWFESINQYEGGFLHGRVVDMFYLDLWKGNLPSWVPFMGGEYYAFWPVFNVADVAISVGIVAIFIHNRKYFAPAKPSADAESVGKPAQKAS